jgi:hypothetical protein
MTGAMKMMPVTSAAAVLALLCTTPARGAEPLQPIGKWNVDFGDAHCIALRNYGSPANPVTLGLKPSPIGDVMQVSVLRSAADKQVDQFDGTLTLDRAPALKVSILGYGSKSGRRRINTMNVPLSTFRAIRSANSLRLRSPGEVDVAFALSQLEPVARALDRCVAGLREVWHLGEHSAVIKKEASLDKPLRKLFSSDDYPGDAVIANASGTVALIMLIDETGKTASCMITQASGRASLDAQSCAIIATRGRFSPALGADGKPIKSGTTGRINWKMP